MFAAVAAAAPAKKPVPPPPPPPSTTTVVSTTVTTATVTTATTTVTPAPPPVIVQPAPTPLADIGVVTLAPPQSVYAGTTVTYTNVVTNSGPSSATGVKLVNETEGGARLLAVAASAGSCSGEATITCQLGSLSSGASAVVTVTVAPSSPALLANTSRASADQADPEAGNNTVRSETSVLSGHAGAPQLSTGNGAFQPRLVARPQGRVRAIDTTISLDEPSTITVQVVNASGRLVAMQPGSRVNYLPTGRPHTSFPLVIAKAGRIPLQLLVDARPGLRYRILVKAVAAGGESSLATIPFTT